MKVIEDLRKLNAIAKRYNMEIDKDYKYITKYDMYKLNAVDYKGKQYKIKFFSGCFYPFIVDEEGV